MDGEHPEWLPVDWKVFVRVRSSGKKDKYYVHPSNGLKFNSKPEVLRYLKNAVNYPKGGKLNKVDNENTVSERLPSVEIEKTRITRSSGKIKRDLYFADPVSGCLQTKSSNKAECTTDDPDHPSEELGDHCKSSTAGVGRKIKEKVDEISSGNENVKSVKPPETCALGEIQKEKDQQEKATVVRKKRKKNSKWIDGLPRRASKRLARVEADPPLEVNTREAAARRLSGKAELVNNDDTTRKSKPSEVNTSDHQKEATTSLPVECASVEKNENKLESSLNDLFMDPCIEFAIKTLTGAIPLEQVTKIHGDPPVQASSSSPVLPFWTDPCFEFAVKTLTSEIPTEGEISFSLESIGCNGLAK